jgi:hypothetical protein
MTVARILDTLVNDQISFRSADKYHVLLPEGIADSFPFSSLQVALQQRIHWRYLVSAQDCHCVEFSWVSLLLRSRDELSFGSRQKQKRDLSETKRIG